MTKKAFFKRRENGAIKKLDTRQVRSQRNLVQKIYELDGNSQGLIFYTQLIPGKHHVGTRYQAEASRKCLKHGEYVPIGHPQRKKECYESPIIPLALRKEALGKLESLSEDQIFSQGLSFKPNWSRDQSTRLIPYVFSAEALRLFAYSENSSEPITTKIYDRAKRVKIEGAEVLVKVPSRRQGVSQYLYKLIHVPVSRNQNNLATVLTLKPKMLQDEDGRSVSQRIPHDLANIRYTRESDQEESNVITFYPHDIASYIAIIRDCNKDHNLTPLEMNPFPLFSREFIENFYKKLDNNILVFDPTITASDHFRRLHLAEKNILMARAIRTMGHDETAFWDPSRDGKLKDYNWEVD